jgi:hypothetical protein
MQTPAFVEMAKRRSRGMANYHVLRQLRFVNTDRTGAHWQTRMGCAVAWGISMSKSNAAYLARMLAQRHPGDTLTPPLLAELLVAIAELEIAAEQAKPEPVVRRIDVLGPRVGVDCSRAR